MTLEKASKVAEIVGICTLFAWILLFVVGHSKPDVDRPRAVSTEVETRYVSEGHGFLLDILMDACVLSILVGFGCTIAKGRLEKKQDDTPRRNKINGN